MTATAPTPEKRRIVAESIMMPDSPVRSNKWYQFYVRLARPSLDWMGVVGGAWTLFLGDWLHNPMDSGNRIIVLTFVCALYGVKTAEKIKGVA